MPAPERFEHDAAVAWRDGPLRALAELGDLDVRGVSVAAMVPSLTAVDGTGTPVDPRVCSTATSGAAPANRTEAEAAPTTRRVGSSGSSAGWPGRCRARTASGPRRRWPTTRSRGEAVLDTTTASLAHPLFDWVGWDAAARAPSSGSGPAQLPRLVPTGWEAGRIGDDGPALASGCIDAMAEQLVAGADQPGDVLVLLGTTLIVWVVAARGAPRCPGT